MIAPVWKLKKKEIVWLGKHRCKHGHTYLEHYQCYEKDYLPNERVGFLDIEASNLNANFGIMFCYCIKVQGEDTILERLITKEELDRNLDKQVVKQCIEDINSFDRLVTFYGKRFDLPFIRTRAVYWGLPFPEYGKLFHDDIYFIMRYKFKLHSNRLENSCRSLLGKTDKTFLDPIAWIKALQGDKKSLNYILHHCHADVTDLEKLYNKIIGYSRPQDCSI
jgi:uncharacterized protein YprB with RNaseH-like and TPR domain